MLEKEIGYYYIRNSFMHLMAIEFAKTNKL